MAETNLFFQDLSEDLQGEIWSKVQQELISSRDVEPRMEDETEEEFQARLNEEVDYYINTHNLANKFNI